MTDLIIAALISWTIGYLFVIFKKQKIFTAFYIISTILIAVEIILLWVNLERPPMRTLGETRLWYSFFLPFFGILINLKLKRNWILLYCSAMAALFLVLNILNPDTFDKTLAPALQSPWFIPHVIVYIVAYALLGATSLYSFVYLFKNKFTFLEKMSISLKEINIYVYIGFIFLTLGLLFGALWAKEAWGHYWTWDPKETWAFISWLFYLNYLHLANNKGEERIAAYTLSFGFIVVLLCWFGVNYMPSAVKSVHTYTN